jgi:hypothetical protein
MQLCMRSPLVTCVTTTFLQDRWGAIYFKLLIDKAYKKSINHQQHISLTQLYLSLPLLACFKLVRQSL